MNEEKLLNFNQNVETDLKIVFDNYIWENKKILEEVILFFHFKEKNIVKTIKIRLDIVKR